MSSIDARGLGEHGGEVDQRLLGLRLDPSGIVPVAGSIPAMPEQKMRPLATIAWLYGPSAAGAWSVVTACRVIGRLYGAQRDRSSRSATARMCASRSASSSRTPGESRAPARVMIANVS